MSIENFPILLRELRLARGLTMAEAARALGVARNTYSRYEHGITRCNVSFIVRLIKLYDVTPEYLLD